MPQGSQARSIMDLMRRQLELTERHMKSQQVRKTKKQQKQQKKTTTKTTTKTKKQNGPYETATRVDRESHEVPTGKNRRWEKSVKIPETKVLNQK